MLVSRPFTQHDILIEWHVSVLWNSRHLILADRKSAAADAATSFEIPKVTEDYEVVFVAPRATHPPSVAVLPVGGKDSGSALVLETLIGRKELVVEKADRSPLTRVIDFVLEPGYFCRVQCRGWTSKTIVECRIQTYQLPMIIPNTKVTRLLTESTQ